MISQGVHHASGVTGNERYGGFVCPCIPRTVADLAQVLTPPERSHRCCRARMVLVRQVRFLLIKQCRTIFVYIIAFNFVIILRLPNLALLP